MIYTQVVAIYRPTRPPDGMQEPLTEQWTLVDSEIRANLQPMEAKPELSPLGYAGIRVMQGFFALDCARKLQMGCLVRESSGDCWRVAEPPICWESGSGADHVMATLEWSPAPAGVR